jgi:predicted transcriptional regulator
MALHRPAETEPRLSESAQRMHRGTVEALQEAVDRLVMYQEWLERKLKDSLAADRGGTVSDAVVRAWLESRQPS